MSVLGRMKKNGYFGLLRGKKMAATCLGFGPRFLRSTGQAYKGGPAPGQKFTFEVVKAAQARGDFQVWRCAYTEAMSRAV